MRNHPRRRSLEHEQAAHPLADARHDLHRRGAGAEHRHAPAGQVVVVGPPTRVERGALEPLESGQLGHGRLAQQTGRGHEDAGGEPAVRGLDLPARPLVVPARSEQLAIEPDVRQDAEAAGAVVQVVLDLLAQRVCGGPVRLRSERERVEVRRDVALTARVRVRLPRAAQVGRALEHDEVVAAGALEPDRRTQSTEAGTDDRDVGVRREPHTATLVRRFSQGKPRAEPPARLDVVRRHKVVPVPQARAPRPAPPARQGRTAASLDPLRRGDRAA